MIVEEVLKSSQQVFMIEGLDCANCAAKVEAFITLTKEKSYERAQNLQQKL